jgi:YggT family protein
MARFRRYNDREDQFHEAIPAAPARPMYAQRAEDATLARSVPERVVYFLTATIFSILALRLLLLVLGANAANGFVNLVYAVTNPLVAPFRGIFALPADTGVGFFDWATLIAMAVYGLAGYLVMTLFNRARR